MDVEILYAGVVIGSSTLESSSGLAFGQLRRVAGYELVRTAAENAGAILALRSLEWRYWPASRGDFADAFASELAGGYELADARGLPIAASSVCVFALPQGAENPVVVVDFRPHGVRVAARVVGDDSSNGDGRRPAA